MQICPHRKDRKAVHQSVINIYAGGRLLVFFIFVQHCPNPLALVQLPSQIQGSPVSLC